MATQASKSNGKPQPKMPPKAPPKPVKVVTRPISIRIPMELAKRLRLRAAAEDRSVTDVVIATLDKHVKAVSASETK